MPPSTIIQYVPAKQILTLGLITTNYVQRKAEIPPAGNWQFRQMEFIEIRRTMRTGFSWEKDLAIIDVEK